MKNYIYIVIASFIGALIAVFIGGLVNNQSADFGGVGITRFPNSGIASRGAYFGTSMPTSITDGTLTVTGATALSGTLAATSDVRLKVPVQSGTVTALTGGATTTISAAQACDSSVITFTPSSANSSTTLPTAATMFADCLTTNGDSITLTFRNLAVAATTTIIAANTSSTLVGQASGDDIIDGQGEGILKFIRASATELLVIVEELVAAD